MHSLLSNEAKCLYCGLTLCMADNQKTAKFPLRQDWKMWPKYILTKGKGLKFRQRCAHESTRNIPCNLWTHVDGFDKINVAYGSM